MAAPHKELATLRHSQQLLVILLFSLVTIVVWVSISLVTSQTKTAIPTELQTLAAPLNPTINTEVLTLIEQKRAYDPSQLTSFPIYSLSDEQVVKTTPITALPNTLSSSSLNSLLPTPTPSALPEAPPEASTGLTQPTGQDQTSSSPEPTPTATPEPTPASP